VQTLGWDNRSRTYLPGFDATLADQLIELGPADSDGMAGFGNGEGQFRSFELLHGAVSAKSRASLSGRCWTVDQPSSAGEIGGVFQIPFV